MPKGIKVKPSKTASLFGMIGCIVFVLVGLFAVVPIAEFQTYIKRNKNNV